jgi:hypothetical protein
MIHCDEEIDKEGQQDEAARIDDLKEHLFS